MKNENKTQEINKIFHFSHHRTNNSLLKSQEIKSTSHKTKGITLVALVVTIVVLLILAGITIMLLFSENGIISKAQRAKEATERARFEEELELVNLEARAQKAMKGTLTAEEYFEILKDKGFITDTTVGGENIQEKDEKDENGNTIYEITTDDGYVFEATIDEEGNIKTEYQGKENNLPPKIKGIEVTSRTTSSINVEVTINRLEDGRISYYYKKENEEEYKELKINTTDLTANYTGLEQNEVYNIKVVVENSKGSDELEINERTGELLTGTITQVGETKWNNGEATIEVETTETGYTIEYQKGTTTGRWEEYEGEITGLKHNDIVYVRLWDGTNGSGETAITILDGINPTVNVSKGTITTSSINVSVSSSDAQSGMPSNPTYSYYIKQSSSNTYPTTPSHTGTNTSYTFTGLTQNTSYDVRVTVQDNAGNTGTGTSTEISTTTVGGATDGLQTGNITVGTTTWSGGKATITLSTSTDFTIQYKIGTGGTWTPSSYSTSAAGKNVTVTGLSHNSIVYARLIDNAGNTGSEASVTVLDGINPSAATITLSSQSTVTGTGITAQVTHTDNQSGVATTSCKYIYNTTSGNLGTTNTLWNTASSFRSNPQTLTLTANTVDTYYLHVLTVDNAGNKTERTSVAVTVTELEIGSTVTYNPSGTYKWQAKYCSSILTETTDDVTLNSSTGQNFNISNWKVLSIDKITGMVELVASTPTTGTVYLGEAQGYNNGVKLLNDACSSLYGNTTKGITARSINIEDIEKYMTDTAITEVYKYGTGASYGNQIESPYSQSNSNCPMIYLDEKLAVVSGMTNGNNGLGLSEQNKFKERSESTMKCNSIQPYQTYWYADSTFALTAFKDYTKGNYYDLIVPKGTGTTYWVASRGVVTDYNLCCFRIRGVYAGSMDAYYMYYSDGTSVRNTSRPLFPIITLKSNLIQGDATVGFSIK